MYFVTHIKNQLSGGKKPKLMPFVEYEKNLLGQNSRKTGKTHFGNTHINTPVMTQGKSKLKPLLTYG
jgi:hypothetical protein